MKKMLLLLSWAFLSGAAVAHAQSLGPGMNVIEKILFEAQLKERYLHERSKPFDSKVECHKYFLSSKFFWQKKSKSSGHNLLTEGVMEKAFSKEEIMSMGNANVHGLKSKVRGTDKYITGGHSLADAPPFPHARPGCENIFREEVAIKDMQGKLCREIKLTFELSSEEHYFQTYCENDKNLKINFDPKNESLPLEIKKNESDCVHCR